MYITESHHIVLIKEKIKACKQKLSELKKYENFIKKKVIP
jgi:hypothetical protein